MQMHYVAREVCLKGYNPLPRIFCWFAVSYI
jgi:hypothetical protein